MRPRDLAEHVVHVLWLHALPWHDHHLAIVALLLALACLRHKLRGMCIVGSAHHLAMEDWALSAWDAPPWSVDRAHIAILQVLALTVANGWRVPTMVLAMLESHLLLELMHLLPEWMFLMLAMMAFKVTGAVPIFMGFADTLLGRGAIRKGGMILTSDDQWLELVWIREVGLYHSCNEECHHKGVHLTRTFLL